MRTLKTTALLTSLLLCVALLALWARSMSTSDFWLYSGETGEHRVSVREGRIVWERTTPSQFAPVYSHGASSVDDISVSIAEDWLRAEFGDRQPAAFDYARRVTSGRHFIAPVSRTITVFPVWAIAALCGAPAAVFVLSRLCRARLRPRRGGTCVRCGYDLRATPARCPECGTPAHGQPERV
jgi:hypothetical protein